MIIDHNNPVYRAKWNSPNTSKWNGAFYYSKEIVKYIIPRVKTDRNWITINVQGVGIDHSIVFIHNNKNPQNYEWLKKYKDLILVCGVKSTVQKVGHLGKAIYLPLSVDVDTIRKYRAKYKTRNVAFAGRSEKASWGMLPVGCERLQNLPRTKLLPLIAQYRKIYAVGRTAIEAKVLGCEVLPYDPRFPDPNVWEVLDCADAARMLQEEIDRIDGKDNFAQ